MFLRLSVSWKLIKQQNTEKNHFCSFNRFIRFNLYREDYTVLFYIWLGLFNFCTWILLDLPEEYKALFISFVSFFNYIYLFVICLFSMLIYSPTTSPQSLIFFFQIELFKSSGVFIFSYRNIYRRKKKISQCEFFQISCSPTPVHQLTSWEDKSCMFVRNKSIIETFLTSIPFFRFFFLNMLKNITRFAFTGRHMQRKNTNKISIISLFFF